jgi:hypothetical protein
MKITPWLVGVALIASASAAAARGCPHMPGYYSGQPNVDPPWYGTGPGWIPSDGFNALFAWGPPPTSRAPEPAPYGTGPRAGRQTTTTECGVRVRCRVGFSAARASPARSAAESLVRLPREHVVVRSR